jgi:antitoxin VapB
MGVQLNIKDADTVRLARDLAQANGESVTATIKRALERERAAREAEVQRRIDRIQEIVARAHGHWKPEFDGIELSTRHGELLYDDEDEF